MTANLRNKAGTLCPDADPEVTAAAAPYQGSDMSADHALSDVLDQLEGALGDGNISVQDVIETLGARSFASVMLLFSLIAVSPASTIPGVTTSVAMVTFLVAAQMMIGRRHLWLPALITRRQLPATKLARSIKWLRRPIGFVERHLKARLTFLLQPPWLYLPLALVMFLSALMPMMEFIPASGSLAAAVIALFAAGWLTRDGALVGAAVLVLLGIPALIWSLGLPG